MEVPPSIAPEFGDILMRSTGYLNRKKRNKLLGQFCCLFVHGKFASHLKLGVQEAVPKHHPLT